MVRVSFLVLAVVIAAIICMGMASAQSPGKVYIVSMDNALNGTGLGGSEMVVNVANISEVTLTDPLVITGSNIDLEEQGITEFLTGNDFDQSRIIDDTAGQYEGRDISGYDLIVIGGPLHNTYTKMLQDKGYLKYTVTDKKMPTMIFEMLVGPGGHKVAIMGDASGYEYHAQDLPSNGWIPEQYAPTAAMAMGVALGSIGAVAGSSGNSLSSFIDKLMNFIKEYIIKHVKEQTNDIQKKITKAAPEERKPLIFGLSHVEIITAVVVVVIFGFAYVVAGRKAFTIENIAIYMLIGGITTVAHDLAHKLRANKHKVKCEYKFWPLGTVIAFITAGLFGNVFNYPGRAIIDAKGVAPKERANIAMVGPRISLLLSLVFLVLVMLKYTTWGGGLATIGVLGFTMNMVVTVYNLMPFEPMDGKKIYSWSKWRWAAIFVPSLAFYWAMITYVL